METETQGTLPPTGINAQLDTILARHPRAGHDAVIRLLQEIQESFGYLPIEALKALSRHLDLSLSHIYGVATFYNQFRFHAPGRFHVQVCRGTACHVKGSAAVLDLVERVLGIRDGSTTRDGLFSLEVVACIGACGLAPVIKINEDFHGSITSERLHEVLDACRKEPVHA